MPLSELENSSSFTGFDVIRTGTSAYWQADTFFLTHILSHTQTSHTNTFSLLHIRSFSLTHTHPDSLTHIFFLSYTHIHTALVIISHLLGLLLLKIVTSWCLYLSQIEMALRDPWVAQQFSACLWPRARSWRPGIESHLRFPVHGACFSLLSHPSCNQSLHILPISSQPCFLELLIRFYCICLQNFGFICSPKWIHC